MGTVLSKFLLMKLPPSSVALLINLDKISCWVTFFDVFKVTSACSFSSFLLSDSFNFTEVDKDYLVKVAKLTQYTLLLNAIWIYILRWGRVFGEYIFCYGLLCSIIAHWYWPLDKIEQNISCSKLNPLYLDAKVISVSVEEFHLKIYNSEEKKLSIPSSHEQWKKEL
jgi:hypothetical protein